MYDHVSGLLLTGDEAEVVGGVCSSRVALFEIQLLLLADCREGEVTEGASLGGESEDVAETAMVWLRPGAVDEDVDEFDSVLVEIEAGKWRSEPVDGECSIDTGLGRPEDLLMAVPGVADPGVLAISLSFACPRPFCGVA